MYSLIIPAFNEQECIKESLSEIINKVYNFVDEIILINDGSTDNTRDIILELSNNKKKIFLVDNRENLGLSMAIKVGVEKSTFENIIYCDADGQIDPIDILNFIKINNQKNYDLISGIRLNRQDNYIKKISSTIANKVRGLILNDTCPDNGCCLKLFKKSLFLKIPFFKNQHRFIPTFYERLGYKVMYIPIKHRKRIAGRSKFGFNNRLWVGIKDLYMVYKILKNAKN